MSAEIEGSCHCGAIRFWLPRPPAEVTDCNCSICRRYGVLWAYYLRGDVRLAPGNGPTVKYGWGKREIEFHHCATCYCLMWWWPGDPTLRERCGVNARALELAVLGAARVRHLDGAGTEEYVD